jgi:hypothetical protein
MKLRLNTSDRVLVVAAVLAVAFAVVGVALWTMAPGPGFGPSGL